MGVASEYPTKVLDLESVIRTETVLSRLPFHNLSKKETVEIVITREARAGVLPGSIKTNDAGGEKTRRLAKRLSEYELYWKVSPNMDHGEPRQLAYDIDTLIVNKRLDEVGRPIPRWLRLGTIRSITRELGRSHHDSSQVKQALLQNASAFVTYKLSYTGRDGTVRWASDHAIRYAVRFRGQVLPDGTRTEAVYINFTDTFRDVIDNTKTRPLDLGYLKSLKPAARRFYELNSYLFYAVLKNGYPYSEVRYSEYCQRAPQKRLTDRHKAQTQMGKIHRPHLKSGYLGGVDYRATTDVEGQRDWILRYRPGPSAVDEHETFSRIRARASRSGSKPLNPPSQSKRLHRGRIERNSPPPVPTSLPLTRFLELFPLARSTSRAVQLAAELVRTCSGNEKMAVSVVERFAETAQQTGWRAKICDFNALFSQDGRHVEEGIEAYRKQEDQARRITDRRADDQLRQRYDEAALAWAEEDFRRLPAEERERFVSEAAARFQREFPESHLRGAWKTDFDARLLESARARAIRRHKSRFPLTHEQWLASVRSADTTPTS